MDTPLGAEEWRMSEKPWFKFYPEWVPRSIEYPEVPLDELLRRSAEKHPDAVAIIFEGYKMTYRELDEAVSRLARALQELGMGKGDRVAIFLPNCPQFVIGYYAILRAGGVVTAVNPLYTERELEYQLNNSEAVGIITLDLLYERVAKVRERTSLKFIIVTGLKDYLPKLKAILGSLLKKIPMAKVEPAPGVYFLKDLLARYPPEPKPVEINPKEDLACLQYTGGTTGVPKGAMLTHYNLVSNAVAASYWLNAEEAKEVHVGILPLFHIYGMTTVMNSPIYKAGATILIPRFDAKKILEAIHKYRATVFCGVPTLYAMLLDHPELSKYDLTSIKFCVSGAAPLPPEVQRRFMEVTGGVLVEGYGLTEASPVTHANPLDRTMKTVKIGSIGVPWPDTEAKIVDVETGTKELPPGEVGELVVRGPQVMKGYWKMPEETSQALRDGWLYTGDIAKMDEDGYFYIVDRKKDLIKYKGYSVYPRELEDVLYGHEAVKLCAVVGKPDPVAGEIPKAFVVLKEGYEPTDELREEILEYVNSRVAPYKRIRELEFRKELPVSAAGKVLRRVLREEERRKAQAQ